MIVLTLIYVCGIPVAFVIGVFVAAYNKWSWPGYVAVVVAAFNWPTVAGLFALGLVLAIIGAPFYWLARLVRRG